MNTFLGNLGLAIPLFALVLVGYVLKRFARLPETWSKGLAWLVFSVALPVMLFRLMSKLSSRPPVDEHLLLRGTNFQIKVWEALLKIPPAALVSYGQLAGHLGQPRAARAVGSAVAAKTVAYLIPCHRVIRDNGSCSNYRWGVERKLALRVWEAGRAGPGG